MNPAYAGATYFESTEFIMCANSFTANKLTPNLFIFKDSSSINNPLKKEYLSQLHMSSTRRDGLNITAMNNVGTAITPVTIRFFQSTISVISHNQTINHAVQRIQPNNQPKHTRFV